MNSIVTQEHKNAAQRVREILAKYAEIEEALEISQAKEFVDSKKDGLNFKIRFITYTMIDISACAMIAGRPIA